MVKISRVSLRPPSRSACPAIIRILTSKARAATLPMQEHFLRPPSRRPRNDPRRRLLQDRARDREPAVARDRARGRPRVLNFCANNYLGLANDPRLVAAAREGLDRYGFGMASVRFICGTQSVHKELEGALAAFLGTDDAILYVELLRRQRRALRDAARRGGRRHQRRAEPREHHRRHPALQGEALSLPQQRHGRPRGEARGSRRRGRALQADRDRRRVLDGRHRRQPAGDLRPRRAPRRAGDGRRFARGRLRRRGAAAARPSTAASRAASTSSPARSARRSAAPPAATPRRGARSSSSCASARGRICSRTRWRRAIAAASLQVLELLASGEGAELRRRVRDNGERFRGGMAAAGLRPRARRASDHPGHARRRAARDAHGRRAARRGHLRHRLFVSGRAEGQGAHPHADERGAHGGADRPRGRGLRPGRPRARRRCIDSGSGNRDESTGQTRTRAGPHADAREEARSRPQRRDDPDREDRDLRHRHPHLEVGRVGAEDDSGADARRPRIRRRDRRDGAGGARLRDRRPRVRRRATSPAASAATAAPGAATCAATRSASASTAKARSPSIS